MLPQFHKVFSVKHPVFYKELKEWRSEYLENQPINLCVYFLITNKTVPRVLKDDTDGILYIGKGILTRNFERIGELINTLNKTAHMHEAGDRYQLLINKFPMEDLKLGVYVDENANNIEKEYLNFYVKKFGELPPLNRQG